MPTYFRRGDNFCKLFPNCWRSCTLLKKGPFDNYVDKRGEGGQKMSVFVHAQGIKTAKNRAKKSQNSVPVVIE